MIDFEWRRGASANTSKLSPGSFGLIPDRLVCPLGSCPCANEDASLSYRYATSLHWSLTQFTPAAMEVYAKNLFERVYSVCVLLFALITFSSFVSSITNLMNHLRSINAQRLEQQKKLRLYLHQHGISSESVNRVWHYLHHRAVLNSVRTGIAAGPGPACG